MTIRIYPTFDAYFYSSFLGGLRELFGPHNVRYSCEGFPALDRRCLAFIVEPTGLKVALDQLDVPKLNERALQWCDVYSKSNLHPEMVPPAQSAKIHLTGPCFPVRFCGPVAAVSNACRNFALRPPNGWKVKKIREHFANWWRQSRYRLPESAYSPEPCQPGYVFFSSTIWKTEPECNQYRTRFMEACRTLPGLRFEGGFMPRPANDVPGFEAYTVTTKYSHAQYVAKTKQSTVAFNTPSVFGCNPWRTAEFMAFGKAIISTPLLRPLPTPLVHGENVHFVDGSLESIREAVGMLYKDADYRHRLERGTREYFLKYLRARSILERILKHPSQGNADTSATEGIRDTQTG